MPARKASEVEIKIEMDGPVVGGEEELMEFKPSNKKHKSKPSSSSSTSSSFKSPAKSPVHPNARFVGAPIKKEEAACRWPDKYTNKKSKVFLFYAFIFW
mgnify:CR=1 FL=1